MNYGWLLFLSLIGASGTVTASESGISCEDCSYQAAKLLAEQHAAPEINCVPTGSAGEDDVDQCSSLVKNFFVLNETSREIFPFTVSHLNQQQPRQELVVWASDRTMTAAYQQQILRALDAKLAITPLLHQVKQQFNQRIDLGVNRPLQPTQAAKAPQLAVATKQVQSSSAANECANDQHAAAVKAALNPQYAVEIEKDVNRELMDQVHSSLLFPNLKSAFAEFSLSRVVISAALGYPELNINWENAIRGNHFVQVYANHGQHDQEESSLVWSVSLESDETVKVELDQVASVIDTLRLSDVLRSPVWGQQWKISPCLAHELAKHSTKTEIKAASKEQIDRYYDLGSNVVGSDFDEGGSGGWICEYSFRGRHGEINAQFLTLCR